MRRTRRGKIPPLGPFTTLVMRAIHDLPEAERYGFPIRDHIARELNEICNSSSVYIVLRRLAKAKHVESYQEPLSPSSKRIVRRYRITKQGEQAMAVSSAYYKLCDD